MVDTSKALPYIIPKKDIEEKSQDEIKDMLGLNPTVKYKDFIVISSLKVKECKKNNHNINRILIDIPIVKKNTDIVIKKINTYHCMDCRLYFITEDDYKEIKKEGSMLHQHMTFKEYDEYIKNMENGFADLNKESLLKRYGYSVSQQDGLKDSERQSILSHVIELSSFDETGTIWNREKIIWFLEHQIEMHPQSCYEKAREKWERDLNFLEDYSHNNPIVYKIRRIIHD